MNRYEKALRILDGKTKSEGFIDIEYAFEVAREAMKKQIPKSRELREGRYYCPVCNHEAEQGYCRSCGNKLY